MTQDAPLVSVIIPHWNGRHHLDDCLNALRRQTYSNHEVILVDNGSSDGSQAYIRDNFPEVCLLELGENQGFTGACNAGYIEAQGDIICLLNNDTEADENWLAEIVAAFEQYPQAGIVAGKLLLFDQRDRFHAAGDYYRVDGVPGNRGVWELDQGQYNRAEPVFSACGGAAAYRRRMVEEVGFLDNAFFFSCEDVDLAWRAHLAGWLVHYAPTAVVFHKLKASEGSGATSSFYDGRNFLYVIWKNYPASLLKRYWPAILKAQLRISLEALKAWRGVAARARLRGQMAGIWGLPRMLPARRRIQATRRISDRELEALLTHIDEENSPK